MSDSKIDISRGDVVRRAQSKVVDLTRDLPITDRARFDKSLNFILNKYNWAHYQDNNLRKMEAAFEAVKASCDDVFHIMLNNGFRPTKKEIKRVMNFIKSWEAQLSAHVAQTRLDISEPIGHLLRIFRFHSLKSSNSTIARLVLAILKNRCKIPHNVLPSFNTLRQKVPKRR